MYKKTIILLLFTIFFMFCVNQAAGAQKRSLTQEDVVQINELEKDWGRCLDVAGPLMSQKRYTEAADYIKQSILDVNNIIKIAKAKGASDADIQSMDRIIGMLILSRAYLNLTILIPIGDNPSLLNPNNLEKNKSLLKNTYDLLAAAERRFSDVPYIQNLCRQLLNELNKIEKFL